MSEVTLYLTVYQDGSTLYTKTMETSFLPRKEDRIQILRSSDPEDEAWSVGQEIKRFYWDGDGGVHIDMRSIRIDPNEHWHNTGAWNCESAWYTDDRDGDLIERLLASGWEKYR